MTITAAPIGNEDRFEVTKPEDSKYDGEVHENRPIVTDTKTRATLTEGTDYTLDYSDDLINAGTVTVTITGTGNYGGTFSTEYAITPRKVLLTSADASKVYDKNPLTKHDVDITEDGFANGEGADYEFTGSQTEVGRSKNTFTFETEVQYISFQLQY